MQGSMLHLNESKHNESPEGMQNACRMNITASSEMSSKHQTTSTSPKSCSGEPPILVYSGGKEYKRVSHISKEPGAVLPTFANSMMKSYEVLPVSGHIMTSSGNSSGK